MKNKIIFALDFPTYLQSEVYIHLLEEHIGCFKIGLQLFIADGKRVINRIKARNKAKIFLDLKLHDIPTTVNKAVKTACEYKPDFLTVHASGGSKMLQAAADGCAEKTQLLAVTLLTSMGVEDLTEIGLQNYSTQWTTLMYGGLAKRAGINGYVCAPLDVKMMRRMAGPDAILVTPGIRLQTPTYDQVRVATPKQAIENGSDYLVIGREIKNSHSPADTVRYIIKSIQN